MIPLVLVAVASKVVDSSAMTIVSQNIGKDWQKLGRNLGLSDGQIDILKADHSADGLEETIYQMLREWSSKNGDSASLKVLAQALLQAKRPDVAKKLESV